MHDSDILEVLFEYGLLPSDQHPEIIEKAKARNLPLGAFLVKNRFLSEKALYRFIVDDLGMNSSHTFKFRDYRIQGKTISKFRTNGDFFGIFPLPNSRVAVTLCDVAGKGIEAALLTLLLAKLLRGGIDMTSVLPASFMKKINQVSRAFFEIDRYSTFVLVIVDLLTGIVEYSAAGSPPIFRYDYKEDSVSELELPNIPIGIFDDFQFRGSRTDLNSGDSLLIFSDGAYEGENLRGKPYGIPRLKRMFKSLAQETTTKIFSQLIFNWRMHEIFKRQADDTTFVLIRRIRKKY